MRIEERVRDNIVIIEAKDRLTVETEADFIRVVRTLLEAGRTRMILDLAEVSYMDSTGLGALAHAYTSAWRRGGELKLLNVQKRVRHLLTITKLITVFEVYESEDEAVRSFPAEYDLSA